MPSFQTIPNILINNSNQAFGGYIYTADYNIAYGNEGASSLIINIVGATGNYNISSNNLRLDQIYTIQVGSNITLRMYLKRFRRLSSPNGKILEVEFIDGSFELDRTFIGLYKRYGAQTQLGTHDSTLTAATQFGVTKPCIIVVGKEHHPCDRNYDGKFDSISEIEDPCHPCFRDAYEQSQSQRTLVDCIETVKYQILPVEYNFTELISSLRDHLFTIENADDPNPLYHTDYVGTVRDVLSHWCSDFGWIFYWENGVIKFRDLRTVINVNATIQTFCPNISAIEDEATLDGTVSSIVVTNYAREGRGKQRYQCQDAVHLVVNLYNKNTSSGTPLQITQTIDETAAAWALYSSKLRTLYYWYSEYGLDQMNNIIPGLVMPELGMFILSNSLSVNSDNQQYTDLDGFAQIGLIDIPVERDENLAITPFLEATLDGQSELQQAQTAIEGNDQYKACFELLTPEDQWRLAVNMKGKYFFVASYNAQLENKYSTDETSYAGQFWGKYYIFVPGGDFWENEMFVADNPNCANSPFHKDGTVSWQATELENASFSFLNNQNPGDPPIPLSSLPFANFLAAYKDGSYHPPDSINFKLAMISKSGEEWNPSPGAIDPDDTGIFLQDSDNARNSKKIDQAFQWAPRQVQTFNDSNGANVVTDILNIGLNNIQDKDKAQIAIFLGSAQTGINSLVTRGTNTKVLDTKPYSGKPLNPNETNDPDLQELVVYEYPQLQCLPIGNQGKQCNLYRMHTPVCDFEINAPTDSPYSMVIEKTKMRNQKLRKIETVMHTGDCPNNQTLSVNVNYQRISDHTISDIKRISDTSICTYDLNTIQAVHNNFAQNLSINQTIPLIKKVFTIEGIDIEGPTTPSINDGLLGLKISVGAEGIRSTYTFGTTKMIPPGKPEVYQLGLMKQLQYTGSLGETFGPGILSPGNGT